MLSERMQRRLDALLDEADLAVSANDWTLVADKARAALALDEANEDAAAFLRMAEANLGAPNATFEAGPPPPAPTAEQPASFAAGRYQVRKFLGEGGKKRVFLAYDALLDRDVAFALIKTDGLDDTGRERVTREAQAMGRMGAHPHVVSVFDLGEEGGAPYIVTELMGGGDVEGELERAGGPLELPRSLELAKGVARGLAFAHERGVVHRDLKPGNVWLTSDGVAKIGDFGLAVAEGRSRLTQHGLMVGTFAYMPPEQALGGEATPRSDLYSLGAMLYELVTGRPPFEGDSPTAVISQHLNTAPVAPSWQTEHCPPALEDLILALLQKDPASRPASASEVLATLEAIDPAQPSRSHSSDSANPLDRLARGVFVGRERELERLRTALDQALAGRGSVVMLVGEPGIGKTRTTQELETYARMRGAKVLWGRAHESSGAPPYWPWVQVARAYREETPDAEVRRRQYEPYAVELQRIFPALRDLFPHLTEPPPETEEGQFRLFDAFSAFARSVAQETPLVFVLDDLHWADAATLGLLTHLARELARARILVVGTYRDTDLDRRHPLAAALAELGREDLFSRVNLRGLTSEETEEYLRQTAHIEPARELVARIFEETEGNPFFLSEVVNLMTEEGSFNASVSDIAVPEGVRQALGRRLDRLSEDANELLTVLAVAGRDFDHALVQALSSHDDAATLRLLEEALRARVLEEVGAGRYRFTHALMQETLAEELSAARRVLLHGQIAEAMERLYGSSPEYVGQIGEHYFQSATLNTAHASLALTFALLSAERAEAALAYEAAAAQYERCIALATSNAGARALDLGATHFALGVALRNAGYPTRAYEAVDRAMAFFKEQRDPDGFGRAAIEAFGQWGDRPRRQREEILQEALETVTTEELRADLIIRFAQIYFDDSAEALIQDARAIAERLGSQALLVRLDHWEGVRAVLRGRYEQGAAILSRVLKTSLLNMSQQTSAHTYLGLCQLALGRLDDAAATYEAQAAGVLAARLPWEHVSARGNVGLIFQLRGDLTAAAAEFALAENITDLGAAAGRQPRLDYLIGELDAARTATEKLVVNPPSTLAAPIKAFHTQILMAQLGGSHPEVLRAYVEYQKARAARDAETGGSNIPSLAPGVEPIAALGTEEEVEQALELLRSNEDARGFTFSGEFFPYLRGVLAVRLDLLDEAEMDFRDGLNICQRAQCPIYAGRCHQGLAEVAERRGDHAEATHHLDAAGELFARHGAKLYLDQVIAKKEILKA